MTNAFLLTRQWRDTREGVALDLWWATEQGSCWAQITGQDVVFFVLREQAAQIQPLISQWRMAEVELKNFLNKPVNALYFKSHRSARCARYFPAERHSILGGRYSPARALFDGAIYYCRCAVGYSRLTGFCATAAYQSPYCALADEQSLWRPSLRMITLKRSITNRQATTTRTNNRMSMITLITLMTNR